MNNAMKPRRCLAVMILCLTGVAIGELVDDFGSAQSGTWAPARWWDDYARRGRLVVPGGKAPKLDVAFSRSRRKEEITAAGGFVVDVDVVDIKGSAAAICIGSSDFEKRGIAVVVYADDAPKKDKLYINGRSFDIEGRFQVGQTVRIEIDTSSFEGDAQNSVSVYFDGNQVVDGLRFRWEKSPLGFFLGAIGGQATFDNLRIDVARPTIEFAGSGSVGSEQDGQVAVDVVLRHGRPDCSYSVNLAVAGGTAQKGVDYTVSTGRLTFAPGQTRRTVVIRISEDSLAEYDETVRLALSDPQGRDVRLGAKTTYSHTIVGDRPTVQFQQRRLVVPEQNGSVEVNVALSHSCSEQVCVGYDVVGGTAVRNQDFRAAAGTLVFEPGQTSKSIKINLLDDSAGENSINETVRVKLAATKNCATGETRELVLEIIDDERHIDWEGCIWLPCSFSKHTIHKGRRLLSINERGQLEWVPLYGDLLLVRLPRMSVKNKGEKASFGWLYKGQGNATGSYVENICERYGSGDLRMAVLDLAGKAISLDDIHGRNDEVFCGCRGYQARLSPHVPQTERADKWAKRVDPFGDNCSSPVDWGGCWAYPKYFNGHGVPVGQFSPLIFTVERAAEKVVRFSVELNGVTHTYIDDMSDAAISSEAMESLYGEGSRNVREKLDTQPENIDLLAIYFANQRPFELITFAPLSPTGR